MLASGRGVPFVLYVICLTAPARFVIANLQEERDFDFKVGWDFRGVWFYKQGLVLL